MGTMEDDTFGAIGTDILSDLVRVGLGSMAEEILEYLDLHDLKCCQLVCRIWFQVVNGLWHHHEFQRVGPNWANGIPKVSEIQCTKQRSVCTVSSMALDERSLLCGLAGSGIIELWDRRQLTQSWRVLAHEEGVYSVDLSASWAVSGGDDAKVKVWNRSSGDLLIQLSHHDYIVWSISLWMDQLVTCSYDCSMAYLTLANPPCLPLTTTLERHIKGHLAWADGLSVDKHGAYLSTHNDISFEISIWSLAEAVPISGSDQYTHELLTPSLTLEGHEDEVNCVKFAHPWVISGSSDTTVRVWSLETAVCVAVLRGHVGKIWCLDADRHRIVSGGRHGQTFIWSLSEAVEAEDGAPRDRPYEECQYRALQTHSKTTAVGQVRIDRALLVSADGLGKILLCDFWNID